MNPPPPTPDIKGPDPPLVVLCQKKNVNRMYILTSFNIPLNLTFVWVAYEFVCRKSYLLNSLRIPITRKSVLYYLFSGDIDVMEDFMTRKLNIPHHSAS